MCRCQVKVADGLFVLGILLILCFPSFQQLEIYEMIGQAISNSRRAGGEVGELFAIEYVTLMRTAHVMIVLRVSTALSELSALGRLVPVEQPVFDTEPEPHGPG